MSSMTFYADGPQPPRRVFAGMRLVDDPEVGIWVGSRIDHVGHDVHGFVPSGFEAYAVIFHPAFRETRDGEQPSLFAPEELRGERGADVMVYRREVRWSEVAAANGRVAHPTMEWAAITGRWDYRYDGDQPGLWDDRPQWGSLPLRATMRACQLLAHHTSTPADCFFGVSFIYGDLPDLLDAATQVLDTRVVNGPLMAVPNNSFQGRPGWEYRSPNLWWPRDRAWFLQSNYDLQETYLGGSDACIESIVTDPELEAMRIDPSQRLVDQINPEPDGFYRG